MSAENQTAPFLSDILDGNEYARLLSLFLIFYATDSDLRNLELLLIGLEGKYPETEIAKDMAATRNAIRNVSQQFSVYANAFHVEVNKLSAQQHATPLPEAPATIH